MSSSRDLHIALKSKRSKNFKPDPKKPDAKKQVENGFGADVRLLRYRGESNLERMLRIKECQWNDDEWSSGKDW
jgi:hypothetical protein